MVDIAKLHRRRFLPRGRRLTAVRSKSERDSHPRCSNSWLTSTNRVFNTERRVGYGVSNATAALVSYDPATHELETVALPAQLPEGALPIGGISVIVPQLKMTYYIGSEGEAADIATPVELLAYNYSDNTIVRRALPANRWATVTYIQAGQKDVLVMLGGLDAVYFLPVSRNFDPTAHIC